MRNIAEKIFAFVKDEEGLTMVEYAVAGTLITVGAVAAFSALGGEISTQITRIVTVLKTGAAP